MPQQTNRVHIRRICILAIAAVALAALTPLANADNDDSLTGACCTSDGCSDHVTEAKCSMQGDVYLGDGTTCADADACRWRTHGFVEIQIDNHPNNKVLGNLYLYIDGYHTADYGGINPTNIVPYPGANQTTGLGFYKNGTGVTYLVDDYKSVGASKTRMPQHEHVDHTTKPDWRGFRINTMTKKAGMNFTLAFGCDDRNSLNNGLQYHQVISPGACFNYDAPLEDGAVVVAPNEFNQSALYTTQKGFAQRCAVFEIAFYNGGLLEDQGDLTDIDFYGFPMNVSGQASSHGTSGINGDWSIPFHSKKYKRNDKWIRQKFKTLMKNSSDDTGPNWYYEPTAPSGHVPALTGKFARAVSPHAFPTLSQGGDFWRPVPENFKFPASYFEWFTTSHQEHYARNFNCLGGENFVLESPLAADEGHAWSKAKDAFQAKACVCLGTIDTNTLHCTSSESGDGKSLDHYSIKFTYTALYSDLDIDDLPGGGNIFDKFPSGLLEIYCIVPNGPDSSDPNYTGWSYMENFILGGDPGGSGAEIVVKYNGTRITQNGNNKILDWNYEITGLDTAITGLPNFGPYCYENGIKAAFGQLSSAITNGWIDSYVLVKSTQRDETGDYFYEENSAGEAIGTFDVAKMEFLKPIYGLNGSDRAKWYDQYGYTILAAQDTKNLVAYASAYTDAYKYGNVLFPTHTKKFNRIKLTIPDLSGNCDSNFSATGAHNLEDILILMNSWGSADCDLNGDMTTDVFDLLQLLTDWGKCS